MMWLMLGVLCCASGGQSDFLLSSMSDMVRRGATIFSRFLDGQPPYFPHFGNVNGGGGGRQGGSIVPLLKLMGIDSRKVDDFAFDGMISLIHLMSQVLLNAEEKTKREGKSIPRDFSSFRFVLGQPQVIDRLNDMQNPDLVDIILKESIEIGKDLPEENQQCIHLLICKTKPFVRGMQRSLRFFMNRENITGREEGGSREKTEEALWEEASLDERMFFFVPSLKEVIQEGDKCDEIFQNCEY